MWPSGVNPASGWRASGNTDYLGSYGNAANTVVYPLTVIALAIAVLIGDGCCAFVSISMGAQETRNAHRSVGSAILLCIISGVALWSTSFSTPSSCSSLNGA